MRRGYRHSYRPYSRSPMFAWLRRDFSRATNYGFRPLPRTDTCRSIILHLAFYFHYNFTTRYIHRSEHDQGHVNVRRPRNKTRIGAGLPKEQVIYLADVISVARHTARDGFGLRRIFGRFNPAKPGVLVKTTQKTYAINTEEFDEFAEVIKKYKPKVEISG